MASTTLTKLSKSHRLPSYLLSYLNVNLNSRTYLPIITPHRTNTTENPKENSAETQNHQQQQQILENEKKFKCEIDNLTLELKNYKEKNDDLLDKYKRSLADSENLRVRLNKQIEDARVFGIQGFCKDLLEVADILGHATNAVPKEELNGRNPHLKNLYEGLTLTKNSLMQVFKRHGLEQVNPLNEKFNPNLHEALFQLDNKSVEPNVVVEVSKVGYKLKERCIRPALVGVSK